MEQLKFVDGNGECSVNQNNIIYVATFGTAICGIATDIAVIITGFNLYRST